MRLKGTRRGSSTALHEGGVRSRIRGATPRQADSEEQGAQVRQVQRHRILPLLFPAPWKTTVVRINR